MRCELIIEGMVSPKHRKRKIPLHLRETFEQVIQVDYVNDTRSLIGRVVGDPLPEHIAARNERSHENG